MRDQKSKTVYDYFLMRINYNEIYSVISSVKSGLEREG